MSIARRVLPARLALKRRDGSGRLAPRAKVSFTTFAYVSPVQTIPLCDQTGTPAILFDAFFHFRSSVISGSASMISPRMRARVSSRHPESPVGVFCDDFVADLRGLLARDVLLAFGLTSPLFFDVITCLPLSLCLTRPPFGAAHQVCRSLRHLVAYGSTNMYKPVNRSRASGSNGE